MAKEKKNKAKKQTQEPTENLLDFDLYFDDLTMLQTDGEYSRVCKVMEEDQPQVTIIKGGRARVLPKPNITGDKWCIKSNLTIYSPFGRGDIQLDFYHDGNVYITGFGASNMDKYQNMDVRCLTSWCQQNGWKIPQILPAVARSSSMFWKHMWEALIIDSDYFDEKFGTRKSLGMREPEPEENDDDI